MFTPRYRLRKESPELKKGAILTVDGCYKNKNYDYICEDKSFQKVKDQRATSYSAEAVENQPEWFEKVRLFWFTESECKKTLRFLKLKK